MTQSLERKKIGDVMIERGLILREWVPEILAYAKTHELRFGEASVALGFTTPEQINAILLEPYHSQDFFRLDPRYFPKVTKELLPVEDLVRFGIFGLGYKSEWSWFKMEKRLNLGMLNVKRKDALEAVRKTYPEFAKKNAIRIFQLLPDEYLVVLEQIYGVKEAELLKRGLKDVDENLAVYLQLALRAKDEGMLKSKP